MASPRASLDLPPLGFGAAAIGNLYRPLSDAAAHQAVAAALAAGINYFDTAPHYGFGLSETRLGAALAELDPQARALVSTKVGRRLDPIAPDQAAGMRHGFAGAAAFEPVFDYSYDAVMRSYEESRRRLRRERIDILFAHDLGRATHGDAHPEHFRAFMEGGYRALRNLRDGGAVGAIGLGVNEWQVCEEVLAVADVDFILLAGRYTLLEQGALDSFLPLCAARGVSVIVGGPYNSGILAQGVSGPGPVHYNYAPAPAEIVARVARLEAVCAQFGTSLAAAALQFPLAHPHVRCVIPGMADAGEVDQAVRLMQAAIPDGLWAALRENDLLHPRAPTPRAAAPAPFLLLHPDDNVVVVRAPIARGDRLVIDGSQVTAGADVDVGHKLARRALAAGDKVYKYGAPIGSMRTAAACGEHVHMHNLGSDYIASHTRNAVGAA
ncbi:MAG: aldo/keto reductase [Caulobacteraceae bacterium]